jgi:hypothetical protein
MPEAASPAPRATRSRARISCLGAAQESPQVMEAAAVSQPGPPVSRLQHPVLAVLGEPPLVGCETACTKEISAWLKDGSGTRWGQAYLR